MSVQYDEFAETFGKSREGLHWPEIDTLLDFFLAHTPEKPWDILDVGCGNGRLLEHILEGKYSEKFVAQETSYTGVDLSEGLLDQARTRFTENKIPAQWMHGNMLELPDILPEEKYSAVFFIASFHHLSSSDDHRQVLETLKKYLAPDGRVFMTNWNLSHPDQSKYQSSMTQEYPDGSRDYMIKIGAHERLYHAFSESSFEKLIQETGYVSELCDFSGRNSLAIFRLAD